MNKTLIYLTALLLLTACGNKKEKMLCQRWQVMDVVFLNEQESLVQSDTMQGNMQQVTKTMLSEVLRKNIYEFKDDGTYMTGNAQANAEGKWKLSGNTIKFISTKRDKQSEKVVPFEKLTEDTLILRLEHDQSTMKMNLVMIPIRE
jgi:hypothetical protein